MRALVLGRKISSRWGLELVLQRTFYSHADANADDDDDDDVFDGI